MKSLFDQRINVAENLKACLREKGYTKVSFAKKTDISRPTLDKVLCGEVNSKCTYDKHMKKILDALEMTEDELLQFQVIPARAEVVYSSMEPKDYAMNQKEKEQYELLMDVLDLCTIYY